MNKFETKYFGEITIDETKDYEFLCLQYKNTEINIALENCNIYGDKLKICMDIINKYEEINDQAKKLIIENFPKNQAIVNYFLWHFNSDKYKYDEEIYLKIFGTSKFDTKVFNIEAFVEKLNAPDFVFNIEENKLIFSVEYMVSKEYFMEILFVRMDEKMKLIDFLNGS